MFITTLLYLSIFNWWNNFIVKIIKSKIKNKIIGIILLILSGLIAMGLFFLIINCIKPKSLASYVPKSLFQHRVK